MKDKKKARVAPYSRRTNFGPAMRTDSLPRIGFGVEAHKRGASFSVASTWS